MLVRCTPLLLLLLVGQGFGQNITTLNLGTQGHNPDFSSFPFTRPFTVGSTPPSTCQVGQLFFNSAAAPGQNIYGCTQPNTWASFGVVVYGTGPNTALEGSMLGQANGVASLDLNGNVPVLQLGNLGSAAFVSSNTFDPAGAAAAAVAAIPRSGSSTTQPALITPTDWSIFNSKQPALGFTPENIANKNAKNGYAGLDSNGLLPWIQLSGVPTASSTKSGILASTDWNTFNSKQAALGFTPEDVANKGVANGYASLSSSGQVPATQLPLIPTKTSQLTNDAGFVTSTQAASAAPVQSVNGQTGAVSVSVPTKVSQLANDSGYVTASTAPVTSVNGQTGAVSITAGTYNQQTEVNGSNVTQRPKLNFAAGSNVTLSASDNGTDTTTVTIGSTGGGLPDPGSNGLVKRTGSNADAVAIAGTDYYAPGKPISDNDLPNTITSSITGNAATATALQSAPSGCSGGQFIQQIGANGNPVACGSAVSGGPSVTVSANAPVASGCSSSTKGSVYIWQGPGGTNNSNSGNAMYACSYTGSSYNSGYSWVKQTTHQVNVMDFGCKADGSTDDLGCFNTAVTFAQTLNKYASYSGGNPYFGADIYLPCGDYAVSGPIVLPRTATSDQENGTANGVVGLIGESRNCTAITGISGSGFYGVSGIYVTAPGSGYTSAPSVSFSGGCTTEPLASAIAWQGYVAGIYVTSPASGCTSMPSCTISGGGGSGAMCEPVGRAIIEWSQANAWRTTGQVIKNIKFSEPSTDGAMAIHYQIINPPNGSGCGIGGMTVCERMSKAEFADLDFLGSNSYTPFNILISGDCNTCIFRNLRNNPGLATKYQTILLGTNFWTNALSGEADGIQYGFIENLACGDYRNGSAPCFVGRLQRSTWNTAFCDGVRNDAPPNQCYAFINSRDVTLTNLANEGNGGTQVLLLNSRMFNVVDLGIGSPVTSSGQYTAYGGLSLVNSSENRFSMHSAGTAIANSFGSMGLYMVSVDSQSYQNQFLNFESDGGASEFSIANPQSNFVQYCNTQSTCATNNPWSTIGTPSY